MRKRIAGAGHNKTVGDGDCTPTPPQIIESLLRMAKIKSSESVIDPCCGIDARLLKYVKDAKELYGYEIRGNPNVGRGNPLWKDKELLGEWFSQMDFFTVPTCLSEKEKYDVAILNPPFSKCQAFRFVKHLLDFFIKKEGRVISIIPWYILQQNKERNIWMASHCSAVQIIPIGKWKPAGVTRVDAMLCEFRHEIGNRTPVIAL